MSVKQGRNSHLRLELDKWTAAWDSYAIAGCILGQFGYADAMAHKASVLEVSSVFCWALGWVHACGCVYVLRGRGACGSGWLQAARGCRLRRASEVCASGVAETSINMVCLCRQQWEEYSFRQGANFNLSSEVGKLNDEVVRRARAVCKNLFARVVSS